MKKELLSIAMGVIVVVALFGMTAPITAQPEFPYTVFGYVYDTDGATPAVDGVTVTVTNLNTSASKSDTTKYGLGYYATDFTGGFAIGNQIQIVADDGAGKTNTTIVAATGTPQLVNLILQAGPEPPTIVSYTISSYTIVPPQTTEIDVAFSEQVDYTIAIETDSTVVYDWTGTATNPDAKVWNGTYEANGTRVPDGDYTVNITGTSTATGLSVVNNTEIITVTTVLPPDETAPTTEVTVPPDTTPISSGTSLDWTNTDVMLSFHRVDNGGVNVTGVAYTNYSMSGAQTQPWTPEAGDTDFTVNVTAEGETTVSYFSVDNAGNTETTKTVIVRIDTTPPGTVTDLNETAVGYTWINWTWTNPEDPGSSGFDHVEVWLDGVFKENTAGESYRAEGLVPNTMYEIEIVAVDVAGNKGDEQNDTATTLADEGDPSVTLTAPNGGEVWNVGSAYDILWTATDNESGVKAIDIYYSIDGGATYPNTIATDAENDGTYTWTVPNDQSTTCKVKVVARDFADRTDEDASDENFTIADEEAPTYTWINRPTSATSGDTVIVNLTATDNVAVTVYKIAVDGVEYDMTKSGDYYTYQINVPSGSTADIVYNCTFGDANGNTNTTPDTTITVTAPPTPTPKPPSRGGGGGYVQLDSDGDGYSDIVELLQGSNETDPCDPDPNCAACLATKKPTPTPAATPTATPTAVPTPVATPAATAAPSTPTPTPEEPGFGAVFAIAGLLAVAYLVLRRKQE